MSRVFALALVLASCGDSGGGPGVTSSSEHVEGTLPLTATQCFTQPLFDVLPETAGDQFDCTATLDGIVLPACGSSEPCWEIVAAADATCTRAPSVRGGNDGQLFATDCSVEE